MSKKAAKLARKDKSTADGGEERNDEERRRLKHLKRQAQRVVDHFAELGLDEFGQPLDNFSLLKYPVREWKFTLLGCEEAIAINPVVMLIAAVCLWGFVLLSTLWPTATLNTVVALRTKIAVGFVWFLQLSKAVIFFFLMVVMFKYGHVRLGKKRDKPEFSTLSYFVMSFTAFVGAGALIYCVQEPLTHRSSHFYAQAGYRSQDEIDMFALNMTVSNWGILYWAHYTLVAVCMSLAVHRFNLPLTFRSCFYPIFGAYTWGWIGDCIDGFAIFVTIGCSSIWLEIVSSQLIAGFVHLGWIDAGSSEAEMTSFKNVTVWFIIFVSSASVISGLRVGIRLMSNAAMGLSFLLLVVVAFLDDTKFVLNLVVQETGYFLQTSVLQLNFWTDAFGQLRAGSGRAIDGKAAEEWWVDAWIIFSLSWAIVVSIGGGVFVATISRGRTVSEVILYGILAPTAYFVAWFGIWGGMGLRQDRQSQELEILGETLFNNSRHFLVDGHEFCFDVPQESLTSEGEVIFTNHLPGVSPVCKFDPDNGDSAIFNVLDSFHLTNIGSKGFGSMLSVLFLLGTALFFVTGSDAATLAIDSMASNGRKNYHWSRRMYWACTSGLLTTILLSSGTQVLDAVETVMFVCSLPASVLLCYLLQSVTLMCQLASKTGDRVVDYEFPDQPEFVMPIYGGIFNVAEYAASLGKVNPARVELGMHRATKLHVVEFLKGACVPSVSLHQILSATYPDNQKINMALVAVYTVTFYGWVCLAVMSCLSIPGLSGMAWAAFVVSGCILGTIRAGFREQRNLRSNAIGDLVSGVLFWPQVLTQMRIESLSTPTKTLQLAVDKCKEAVDVDGESIEI